MGESLEKMVDEKVKPEYYFDLSKFKHKEIFDGVEYVWDALKKLEDYISKNIKSENHGNVDSTAIIGKDVYIGKGTIVEPYAVIKGPAIIGDGCLIQSFSYIRENVLMGDFTRLGTGTELKHCIMIGGNSPEKRDKANAGHVNYIGYSIVGKQVLFGRATTTSSLRLDWKEIVAKIEDKKYGTGLKQFGAIIGDGASIGTNTCLNPASFIGKNSWVYGAPHDWRGFLPPEKIAKGKGTNYEVVDKK